MIVAKPDQKIKMRMMNSGSELMAIHTHGHKATITHYDGIAAKPDARITRDVYNIAPAQRLDLELNTTDDGLHNYGEGLWIFHDHAERGITTDGMNPGGNVSVVAYESWLTEEGLPKAQGRDLTMMFADSFFARSQPVFAGLDEWDTWGAVQAPPAIPKQSNTLAGANQPQANNQTGWLANLLIGLLLGVALYILFTYREKIFAALRGLAGNKSGAEVSND
jgi:FtsP/CotA-like multicopper oxidase with cupredoxin domain